ncbi:basic amino acid ABC transporter substrate-binding protein [Desulfobacter hydrogenophilus]|uniref:Basic amino acid ABC transporter substrate-binding protein n=2 Tax=Desulfobacter hydrogenophilus TaxID=2291 RepID=A0A328F8L0_9BACT|nr:basic amino acid ABC transporter substrate-binding protein [Desulfobacter hydrogenophilus]NDY73019.1 basic amino acid ABC transporter substrate-binding protein [Desulfobacter hydrogenophilus]QBH15209.1 basic amino acid ABC transporter substrate-binding protein [Desulfobacter hydrogenophilus]RAM00961.1 basic amino acid ABC transporter substrate-binding protein [Desulfobacter hydrogenophilus]
MKLLKLITVLCAICSGFLMTMPGSVFAAETQRVITVASDATWPPMEMIDENKNLVGFDIDFMNAVAKEAGFKAVIKNTAWDGIFAGVEGGKYDAIISSVTITDKRKKAMDFSMPYVNAGQVLVVPVASSAKVIADLKGKTLGAQIGTTGAMEIKKVKGVELKSYDEIGLTFEDMASGRLDGVVCDTPIAANYALQKESYKGQFKITGKPFTQENYGIVVKKGNKEIVDLINKGIKAVQAKGIDKELEKKWLQ